MKEIKVKVRNIICIFIIFPFIEPLLYKEPGFELIDNLYSIAKILAMFFMLYANVKVMAKKRVKLNMAVIYLCLFELCIVFSTWLHNGDFVKYCGPAVNVLGLTFATYYYYPRLKLDYIKNFIIILFIHMIINDISVLFFPQGVVKNAAWSLVYFLGIDNRFIFFYLPLIFFVSIYTIETKGKLSFLWWLCVILTIAPIVYLWSVGAMIGIVLLAVILGLFINNKKITKVEFKTLFIIIIILNVILVFFNILDKFSYILVDVLGKDVTLSGRTYLWEEAKEIINYSPAFGIGVQSNIIMSSLFYGGVTHPHNLFLSTMIESGIIGFAFYLLFVRELSKGTSRIKNQKIKFIINITIFLIYILSLADTLAIGLLYAMFIIGILYNEVNENEEKNRNINIT